VDVGPTLVADREAPKPMEPRDRPLDHPSADAEPAAVGRPPFGEYRHGPARPAA
jgi:hypothetical protein